MAQDEQDNLADMLADLAGNDGKPAPTKKPAASEPPAAPAEAAKPKPKPKPARRPMPTPQPKKDGKPAARVNDPSPTRQVRPAKPVVQQPEEEEEVEGVLEDEHDEQEAADPMASLNAASSSATAAPRRTSVRPKRKKDNSLKATAVPILITVGCLLLVPAIWAVMILGGSETAWGAERENASSMAKIMLVCWPLALILIISALVMIVQMLRDKKRE